MSIIHKRLADIEERKAARDLLEREREFEGRSREELMFLAAHGFWPETSGADLPPRQEFTVGGMCTVITVERVRNEYG